MTRHADKRYQICTQETVRSVRHNKMQAGLRSQSARDKGCILSMTALVWQSHLHPSGSETQQYNIIRSQHHRAFMTNSLNFIGSKAQPSRADSNRCCCCGHRIFTVAYTILHLHSVTQRHGFRSISLLRKSFPNLCNTTDTKVIATVEGTFEGTRYFFVKVL